MATSYHRLFHCNITTSKDDGTLPSSSSYQTQNTQNTQKNNKKKKPRKGRELTFKLSLCPFIFGSHFYLSVSNVFSWHLLLLKQEKQKNKEKNHREEKKCKEERELSFKLLLCPFTFGSRFYPFVSNTFSWHLLLFKHKKKKKKQRKKKP